MTQQAQLPDGTILEFPDDTPLDVIQSTVKSQLGVAPLQQPETTLLEDAGQIASDVGSGIAQGFGDVLVGAGQAVGDIAGAAGADVSGARELLADTQRLREARFEQGAGATTSGEVGQFIGSAAPFAVAPVAAAGLPLTAATGAVTGALAGGTAPVSELTTPEDALTQRGVGSAIGGTVGAAAPFVAPAAGAISRAIPTAISQKLFKVDPSAAKDFASEQIQQSLATISNSAPIQLLDRFISKFPGGMGRIQKNTEQTLDDLTSAVERQGTAKAVTEEEAGILIKEGVKNFSDKFSNVSDKLYNRLDNFVPKDTRVAVGNATRALQQETGAEGISPRLAERIQQNEGLRILRDISDDAIEGGGGIPYESLKRYRSIVGKRLNNPVLLPGEERAVLNRTYAALTDDLRAAAEQGGEAAVRAFDRANDFYRRGAQRLESLQNITRKDSEDVLNIALQKSKRGGTRINAIMRSLRPEEKEVVRATVLSNLGRARPGQRGVEEQFSPRTYLTNWNQLAPEAKSALFGKEGRTMRDSLDRIARISDRITQVDRFGNPSGTAQQLGAGALFLGGLVGGGPGTAATAIVGANVGSRLLTNQKFVRWLADASEGKKNITPGFVEKSFNRLSKIAEKDPALADAVSRYIAATGAIAATRGGENQ